MLLLAVAVVAYLLGSIPSGVLVARAAGVVDPRQIGSGNIGATNVLRTGRKDLAAITLIADALKGTLAVVLAWTLAGPSGHAVPTLLAAAAAFTGHLFPVFIGFSGGKGVATFLGCLIGIAWLAACAFAVVWIVTAYATRYSSAAALAASAVTPLVLLAMQRPQAALVFFGMAVALWLKHRGNIGRLMRGDEHKIGGPREIPT